MTYLVAPFLLVTIEQMKNSSILVVDIKELRLEVTGGKILLQKYLGIGLIMFLLMAILTRKLLLMTLLQPFYMAL